MILVKQVIRLLKGFPMDRPDIRSSNGSPIKKKCKIR